MDEEKMERLRIIAEQQEISEETLEEIIRLAKEGQRTSTIYVPDEVLYEIIVNALMNYDDEEMDRNIYPETGQSMLLTDEEIEMILSDDELKNLSQELQKIRFVDNSVEICSSKRKSLVQLLNKSVRSLGK